MSARRHEAAQRKPSCSHIWGTGASLSYAPKLSRYVRTAVILIGHTARVSAEKAVHGISSKRPRNRPPPIPGEVLRQHLDLWRQRALVEQEAFEALDELIALGD